MSDASRVLVAVRVRASAARAFAVFTEQIDRWWRPNGLFEFTHGRTGTMRFDPGADGRLVEGYDDGTEFEVGRVRVWEPPERLVVGWRQAGFAEGEETELHVTFREVPGGEPCTRVTVEHFGWDRIPPEHAARHGFPLPAIQQRYAEWWQGLLAGLDRAGRSGRSGQPGRSGQSSGPVR